MVPSPLSSAITQADVQSHPIHYAWDRFEDNIQDHCFNVDGFFIASGSINVILNFIIFVLVRSHCACADDLQLTSEQPIPLLWRLRTTLKQQIILTALFTLAGLYVFVSDEVSISLIDVELSVVLVSIVWVIVLSRIGQSDVTCKHII